MKSKSHKNKIPHITIKLKKDIYPLGAIQKSADAFKHLADMKIENKRQYFIVKLTKVNPEARKLIKDEFCNYVLANIRNI